MPESMRKPKPSEAPREAPASMVLATWILIGASLWFGIDATLPTAIASDAATELLPTHALPVGER